MKDRSRAYRYESANGMKASNLLEYLAQGGTDETSATDASAPAANGTPAGTPAAGGAETPAPSGTAPEGTPASGEAAPEGTPAPAGSDSGEA